MINEFVDSINRIEKCSGKFLGSYKESPAEGPKMSSHFDSWRALKQRKLIQRKKAHTKLLRERFSFSGGGPLSMEGKC